MQIPWWAWLLLALVAVVAFFAWGGRRWQGTVRQEVVDYFAEHAPELVVEVRGPLELVVREQGAEDGASLYLQNTVREASALRAADREGRAGVYQNLLAAYREGVRGLELDGERDLPRLRPRLLTAADVESYGTQAAQPPAAVETGVPGLLATVVVDSEASVRYLNADDLEELGLTADDALARAVDNFRDTLPGAVVRNTLDQGELSVFKDLDSYDAARLLLVPDLLGEGESVVALIPDRDTLALAPVPADGDWSSLRKLAHNAAGPPLWTEPVVVTRAGLRSP